MDTLAEKGLVSPESNGGSVLTRVFTRSGLADLALQKYVRQGHHQVEGWLLEGDIALICALADVQDREGVAGVVAEIGVHHGRLLILLQLLTRPSEKCLAWDLFSDQEQNVDGSGCGDLGILQENLKRHGCDLARVETHQINSLHLTVEQVLRDLEPGLGVRLFSVDGSHALATVYHDLEIASQVLSPAGVLLLDDFFNRQCPGVTEAVLRFLSNQPRALFPVAIGGNKLYLARNQSFAWLYRQALGRQAGLGAFKVGSLAESPVLIYNFFKPPGLIYWLAKSRLWLRLRHTTLGRLSRAVYRRL